MQPSGYSNYLFSVCRPIGGLFLAGAVLSGCAQLDAARRDLMAKPYDAPVARAEAAQIDPTPLRSLFPDMLPPWRKQSKKTYLRSISASVWSLAFGHRLSVAAAPMCFGGLYAFNSTGEASVARYSMALDKGKAKPLFRQIDWVAPYASKVDGSRVGDIWLGEEVVSQLPEDAALQTYQSRMETLDGSRYKGVLRDGQYVIVEQREHDLRMCKFHVSIVENEILGFPALIRHRSDVTSVPSITTVYEHALEVFSRDEELYWFFVHEYAAGLTYLNFGGSQNRDLRKRFSTAVEGAISRMAQRDGIDPSRVNGKVFRDSISTYYLALYIGHNATLEFDDYLAELRVTDSRMLYKVDAKIVEYRERLLRHWWEELRVQHATGTLAKPDPMRSAAALEVL